MSASQENAVRSAQSYVDMMGFSRQGLIDQLSSEYGDQYSVADATLAVDSLGVDWNVNAGSNATAVAGLPAQVGFAATKGDLIVLGDFDANGKFDGKDLYLMARGTSLADSAGTTTLTTATANNFGETRLPCRSSAGSRLMWIIARSS